MTSMPRANLCERGLLACTVLGFLVKASGWLVGWLVGWLAGWLDAWLVLLDPCGTTHNVHFGLIRGAQVIPLIRTASRAASILPPSKARQRSFDWIALLDGKTVCHSSRDTPTTSATFMSTTPALPLAWHIPCPLKVSLKTNTTNHIVTWPALAGENKRTLDAAGEQLGCCS